nr:transposase [Lactiplantibacillus plantarum]
MPLTCRLKRDTVQKEAVHIAIGIRPDGTKEVLNYQVAPTESTGIWTELLGTFESSRALKMCCCLWPMG